MNSRKTAETFKIHYVQCQYVGYAVHVHGCSQPRIVYLNTQNFVLQDNPPPLSIKGFIVWQETHAGLDGTDLPLRFRNCQAKTIAALGTRHSVPKLSNVLVRVVKSGALGGKSSECRVHELVLGIGAPCHP